MLKVQKNKMDMFSYPDLGGDCMGAYLCIELLTKKSVHLTYIIYTSIKTKQPPATSPLFAILY